MREVADQPDDVVADRRDREALDRLLQPELQLGAPVHRLQHVAVLLLQLHVDARSEQIRGARELPRQRLLPLRDRPAGAHRRRLPASQKRAPGFVAGDRRLLQHLEPLADDLVIGAARAEAVKRRDGIRFELGGERDQLVEEAARSRPSRRAARP